MSNKTKITKQELTKGHSSQICDSFHVLELAQFNTCASVALTSVRMNKQKDAPVYEYVDET